MHLSEALEYCMSLTKQHSSTFYLGSQLFRKKRRQAVSVVYAVCRSGDDAVDEVGSAQEGREQLELWWQHIENVYNRTVDNSEPLEVALAWVLESYDVPKEAFRELYLGFESDLEMPELITMDELMLYCRRVAGVVGFMIAPIAGYSGGAPTLDQALALGQAMQLTNVLRDVGEDFRRDRCYLPKELLEKYDINVEELRAGEVNSNYVALLQELFDITHQLYRKGWQGIPKLKGMGSFAVGVAALNYEGILRKVEQNHYDNLNQRAYLRTSERLLLIPKAIYSVKFSS